MSPRVALETKPAESCKRAMLVAAWPRVQGRPVSLAYAKAAGLLDVHIRAPSALCKHYVLEDIIAARGVGKKPPRVWS